MDSDDETTPLVRHQPERNPEPQRAKPWNILRWLGPHYKYVEATISIYFLAISGLGPLLDQIIHDLSTRRINSDILAGEVILPEPDPGVASKTCNGSKSSPSGSESLIQAQAATWLLYIKLAGSVPAIFSTLIITSLSDTTGRKLGLVLSMFGGCVRNIIFTLVYYLKLNPIFMMLGALVDGVFGSWLTTMACSFAYVSDMSSPDTRTIRFVVLQTIFYVAVSLMQLLMGYIIRLWGYGIGLWTVAVLTVVSLVATVVFIKDSKPEKPAHQPRGLLRRHSSFDLARDEVLKAVKSLKIFTREWDVAGRKRKLFLLLFAFLFTAIVGLGESSVKVLYLLSPPICFDSVMIGYYTAGTLAYHGLAGLLVVWLLKRCMRDGVIALIASLSAAAARFVLAASTNLTLLLVSLLMGFGTSAASAVIRAAMSTLVPLDHQGTLFAALFSIETVCDTLSNLLINAVYSATYRFLPGFVFILTGTFNCITVVFICVYLFYDTSDKEDSLSDLDPPLLTTVAPDQDPQDPDSSSSSRGRKGWSNYERALKRTHSAPTLVRQNSKGGSLRTIDEDHEHDEIMNK